MKFKALLLAAVLVTAALPLAHAATITNVRFPVDIGVFIPCANNGAGEVVVLSGRLHETFAVTVNANSFHLRVHDNPQGITGVGDTTGEKYQGTGVTRQDINASNIGFPARLSYVNNFRIIGQGTGNNFLVHETVHFTINADGTVVAFHDNFSFECK